MSTIDTFRDKTNELLKEGLKNGLITTEDYRWRSTNLARAESVEEIESIVEDLLDEPKPRTEVVKIEQSQASIVTVMSERRVAPHELGQTTHSSCVMGETVLDYSTVDFSRLESTRIDAFVLMGETVVVLPESVRVQSSVVPMMAEYKEDRKASRPLEGPVVKISGFVFMGSLRIKYHSK